MVWATGGKVTHRIVVAPHTERAESQDWRFADGDHYHETI
jgi:hypothetical protein